MDRDDIFQDTGDRLPIALPSGTLLRDQFRIGRVLGAGGFGVTYLGFDELLERPVAVKEYFPRHLAVDRTETNSVEPRSAAQDQDFDFGLQRFLQEARTLAKFEDHPNIVRVRTFFGENGTGYLVMNYYEGYTLEEYIEAQSGWLPEDEALYIIHDVLKGLDAAHDAGVLHRDIDPSNIYLTGDGRVVLLDFGAARAAVGERTQTLSVMLKRGYAPHEQYHSRGEQGPWTDIYATAATLYRTLTGYKPPEAPARVMNEDLVPPIEISPSLSQQVNDAIIKGLEVLPQNRPQNISEFRDYLPDPPGIEAASWIDGNYVSHDHDLDGPDQGDAVVDITADAACRLYVNGRVSKVMEAGQRVSLNLARGSHRLRAVRTDRAAASGGTATLTTTATTSASSQSDYVSLRDLIWQSEVNASPDSPTAVHVAFGEEAVEQATSDDSGPSSSASLRAASGTTETVASGAEDSGESESDATDRADDAQPGGEQEENDTPAGDAIPVEGAGEPPESVPSTESNGGQTRSRSKNRESGDNGMVSSGSTAPTSTPSAASDPRSPSTPAAPGVSDETDAGDSKESESDLAVALHHASKAARKAGRRALNGATAALSKTKEVTGTTARSVASRIRDIEWPSPSGSEETASSDDPSAALGPTSEHSTSASSGTAASSPAASSLAATGATSPEAPSFGESNAAGTEGDRTEDRADDRPAVPVDLSSRVVQGGIAVGVLLLAVVGWWAIAGSGAPAQPANQAPVVSEDIASTQTDSVIVNVTRNDSDPEGSTVRLASVTAPPATVGTVTQLDSTRIQFQPANGFSGVAEIRHTVVDADSNFVESTLKVRVPFPPAPTFVFEAPGDPQILHPADLTGDGTPDLITTTYTGNRVLLFDARYEEPTVLMDGAEGAIDASTADMDGDGDLDVLASAFFNDAAYVIQNITQPGGDLAFADPIALPSELKGSYASRPADIDGDGLLDVVAVSKIGGTVVWFRNTSASGGFTFAEAETLIEGMPGIEALEIEDIDGDGDPDLLTADYRNDTVAWHENTTTADGASFTAHPVDESATGAITVAAADLDGDGLSDMLASTAKNDRVTWYRQVPRDSADTSPPKYEAASVISEDVDEPESVVAADVDNDGDPDVLTASFRSGTVAWHENTGDGTFGAQHVITRDAPEALAVLPIDMDGDGDLDVTVASQGNDQIAWFENAIMTKTDTSASETASPDSLATEESSSDDA